jgi:lysophospholipase L1-like esterase
VLPNEASIVGDIYDTDDASFCGCFNQCLRYLQENTKAQIVVIIMIGANDKLPETPTATRKISQFEFAQKIELVAKLNCVPVINVFCESGFGYARVKNRDYQVDQIHLNDLGGLNMGNFVWSKLKDIPLWKTECE